MIRRRIDITKLGQLYEKEKIEYGNERAKKAALMEKYTIAQNLLDQGLDIVDIMKATGFMINCSFIPQSLLYPLVYHRSSLYSNVDLPNICKLAE